MMPTSRSLKDDSASSNTAIESTLSGATSAGRSLFTSDFETTGLESLTDSLFTSSTRTEADFDLKVTKEMIDKKQFEHDVELLKIELSQRNLLIDTMKAEHLSKIDEMEEKLADAVHQKQLIIAQFQNQLRRTKEECSKESVNLKQEIRLLLKQQKEMNLDNQKLMEKAIESKDMLTDLQLDEDEYLAVKGKSIEEQTLREFISLKFYEALKPLKVQCEALQSRIELFANDVRDKEEELANIQKELDEERHARTDADLRCQKLQIHVEELRDQLKRKDYKNENFDIVRSEKDKTDRELIEISKDFTIVKAELQAKSSENEALRTEMMDVRQTISLLKQDKEYLTKELAELKPKHGFLEQKFEEATKQLDDLRKSREELYEKYIHSRDHYKSEYEERLRREIEEISRKTAVEMDKIKLNSQEIYERENRSLRESRDNALAEKERTALLANELDSKYKDLLSEFRNLQVSSESRASELANEVRLKSFDAERVQLVYEDTCINLKKANLENEKLRKQYEILNKEFYALQVSSSRRVTELEGREVELKNKLTIYEKMEEELDDVVMQAAEMSDDKEAERVLFSYGYGANVPSTAKRRMQQSVHLAKRVLQLERANTSLRHERELEGKKKDSLAEELSRTTTLLNEAKQPYNYLIESIKVRDDENKRLKDTIKTLQDDIRNLRDERTTLKKFNDQMTIDLERLLNQKEEMNVLKHVVMGMKESEPNRPVKNPFSTRKATVASSLRGSKADSGLDTFVSTPKPTVIVKGDAPSWYYKLKAQNDRSTFR